MSTQPASKAHILSLCLSGRLGALTGSPRRHTDPDEALASMMTAVLWQSVKDYLWMLANGMISEADPFDLSPQGLEFGITVSAKGLVTRTNGQNIEGRCAGGARGMRDLLFMMKGRHLATICEFTNFHASRLRARLSILHARYRDHAQDVRRVLTKIVNGESADFKSVFSL
jgi:hypothetical protein